MKKKIFQLTMWVIAFFVCYGINHEIRKVSQHNKVVYEVVKAMDYSDFILVGGGSFGYANYYKWYYAKWRNDPARTSFEKKMFWNFGILYDAGNPPKEYQFRFIKRKC